MRAVLFRDQTGSGAHLALVHGDPAAATDPVLVRVHEPLSVIDLLDAGATRHSWNLSQALARVASAEAGVVVLLNIGEGADSFAEHFTQQPAAAPGTAAALRNYGIGAQILRELGVRRMRLLAAPRKMPSMTGFGLEVEGFEPPPPFPSN